MRLTWQGSRLIEIANPVPSTKAERASHYCAHLHIASTHCIYRSCAPLRTFIFTSELLRPWIPLSVSAYSIACYATELGHRACVSPSSLPTANVAAERAASCEILAPSAS